LPEFNSNNHDLPIQVPDLINKSEITVFNLSLKEDMESVLNDLKLEFTNDLKYQSSEKSTEPSSQIQSLNRNN